jgi:hypothetical protein
MLRVTYDHFMLSVIMLSVIILNVVMLSAGRLAEHFIIFNIAAT